MGITRSQALPGNADPEALPRFCLVTQIRKLCLHFCSGEAEPHRYGLLGSA